MVLSLPSLRTAVPLAATALLMSACLGGTGGDDGGSDTGGTTGTDSGATGADTGETEDPDPVWTEVSFETSESVTGVYASGVNEAWVSVTGGKVRLFQAGSWNDTPIDVDGEDINGIWGSGSGAAATVVAVGDAGYIGQYEGTWTLTDVGTANFESVDGPTANNLLAVGWGGLYTNASGTWTFVRLDGDPRFNHIWYDGTVGAAVGEEGVLAIYSGGEWTLSEDEDRRSFYGVSGTGVNDIWAVGEGGVVLHWNGTTWEDRSPDTRKSVWGVWAATVNDVYIVGNQGLAMKLIGGEWTDLPTGVNKNLYAVHGTGVNDVWAVGGFGTALRYQP
ncbi:MAG: hypothetical protein H6742_10800 [Alphaproteobacteria bacterium]|nr:hypothetical protein [Alphaproteobacteria bacterium]